GREVAEQSLLVRALLTRMGNDITASLAATPPDRSGSSGGGANAAGGGAAPAATAPQAGAAGGGNASGQPASTPAPAAAGNSVTFNLGVQGSSDRLTLFLSRVPRELSWGSNSSPADAQAPVVSDLRRVPYWLAGSANQPLGLARQEISLVTSDDALSSMPPDGPGEGRFGI